MDPTAPPRPARRRPDAATVLGALALPALLAATLCAAPGGHSADRLGAAVGVAGGAGGARRPADAAVAFVTEDEKVVDASYHDLRALASSPEMTRWLWWPAILYLFWAMAYVCDMYFVRTIDVISEKLELSDDVAGATLMALGCNGPEMALNTIAVFHPSEIGIGAVIGGEVFNVLVIIGTALLATPAMYMPLRIGRFTFFRDVFFYVLSVALLYWTLADGQVTRFDSAVLLSGAASYILTVVFSDRLRRLAARLQRSYHRGLVRSNTFGSRRSTPCGAMSTASSKGALMSMEDYFDEEEDEVDHEQIDQWEQAFTCRDPEHGSVVGVRVDVRNRLMDRRHHFEQRFVVLGDDNLFVSTAPDPRQTGRHTSHCASGLVFNPKQKGSVNHWHHGGLINPPMNLTSITSMRARGELADDGSMVSLTLPLVGKAPQGLGRDVKELSVTKYAPWEVIPIEDVLYCERSKDARHWNLHVTRHHAELGNDITLEFSSKDEGVVDAWVEALKLKLIEQRRSAITARGAEPPVAKSCLFRLRQWLEWLQFPVKFWLDLTIPDMDDPKQQHLYPVSFALSMAWLALFAYSVVAACDGIHRDFQLSTTILGFTVAAAGTSFPNVFSGMVVARQGKTTMAVANALGANVQNVFLALAIPWTLQSWFLVGGPFHLKVSALVPAIAQCYVTLLPVVLVFVVYSFSVPRWSGALFLATYAVYLVFALGEEASGCAIWPLSCQ